MPLRVTIAPLRHKHAFNESDGGVMARWGKTPGWQFLAGQRYFKHRLPCDANTLVKFGCPLGDEGEDELLAQTVNVAVYLKLIPAAALATVVVDSTLQAKVNARPTNAKLLETACAKMVPSAQHAGIELKETLSKKGRLLHFDEERYANPKQFTRPHRVINCQSAVVGSLVRELELKAHVLSTAVLQGLSEKLTKAQRIAEQSGSRKNSTGTHKPCAWHAPEAECITKCKNKTPYEFGVEADIASTSRNSLIVGAKAIVRNPRDDHMLHDQLEQAGILMQKCGVKPATALLDLGDRGVKAENPHMRTVHRSKSQTISVQEGRQQLQRRQKIEPIIGHLKADHCMNRFHLKREQGDRLLAVLCIAVYNLKLPLMIAHEEVTFLQQIFCASTTQPIYARTGLGCSSNSTF